MKIRENYKLIEILSNNSFIRNGMLGYWRFDETSGTAAYDTHHVITNDNKEGPKFNNALSFDGVNDYVRRPSGINLPLGKSPRTFMAWIKPASYPDTTYNGIVAYGKPECNRGSMLSIKNNGQLSMAFWCNDAYQTTGPAAGLNEWSHAAFTYDGGTKVKFYMNGMFVQESILSGGFPDTADGPIRIGCTDDPGRCFNGTIDDARIYNRALSGDEIAGIYNSSDNYQIWRPGAVSFDLALPGGAMGGSAAIYDIERNLQSATIVDLGSHVNVTFSRSLSSYEGKILYLYFERPAPAEPHNIAMISSSAPYSVVNGAIEGYRLRIAPDKNVYSAGEPVILTTQLANVSGIGMIADITTTIYYPNGTIAQVNNTQTTITGEASANYTIPALKGIFIAVTETSVSGITRKENTSFNVGDLVVHVSPDRTVYNTLENTNINLKVTQNDSITAADVTLKIYDPNSVKVFEETKNTGSFWTDTSDADFKKGTLSNVNVSGGSVTLATQTVGHYYTSGSLVSKVYDGGSSINWGKLMWSAILHPSDSIIFYTRTSQNNITWSGWVPGIYDGDIQNSSRYLQYKADFATTNDTKTPTLEDVTIEIAVPVNSIYTLPDSPTGNYTLAVSATSSGNAGFNTTVIELDRFDISAMTDKPVYTTSGNITVSGTTNYRGGGANANVSLTAKKNLAFNPSFETDIDSNAKPDGWIFAGSPWNGTGTRDTISRAGNYSVKVFRSITNTTEGVWYYPNMYIIMPNVNYTFSVWAKSDNIAGGNMRLWVSWYNGTTSLSTAINAQQTINAQNGWVLVQGNAMSPANANNARVYLVSNIVGNAWFDDVTIDPENNPAVYASSTISSASYGFTFSLASPGSYIVYSNGSYAATLNRSTTTVFTVRSLDVNASAGGPFEPGAGSVTIKGYVVDNRTGMAVPNATVQINITYPNGTLKTYTNTTTTQGNYTYTISTPQLGGTYVASITAIDYQNVKGFSNTSFRVNLTLSVAANRTQYNPNETALISVNVSDSNSGINGAVVNISVKNPANLRTNFSTLYGNVTYQGNGVYTANYSGTALRGNYTINATASNGTDNGSSNSSFMVRRLNVTIQGISVKVGESRSILARVEDETTRNTTANATVNITITNASSVINQTTTASTNQSGYNIAAPLYTDRAGMYNITMNVSDMNNIKGQVVLSYTVNLSVDLVLDQTAYDPNENLKGTITIRDSITSMASSALVVTRFEYYNGTIISSNTTTSDSLGMAQVEFTAPSGYFSYIVKVTASKNGINGTDSRLYATSNLRIWTDKGEAQIGGSAWAQNDAPEEYRNITIKVAALSSAGIRRTGQDLTARIYYPNGTLFGNYALKESDKIYSGYVLLPGKNIPEGKYDIELAEYPGVRSNFSVMVWGCVNCHKPNSVAYHYYSHNDISIAPSSFETNHSHRILQYDGCGGGGCHSSYSTNCLGCHTFEGSTNPPTKCNVCHNSFNNKTQGYLNDSFGFDIHANINNKPGGQWYGKPTACESCHGILNSTQKPFVPLCTNCHPNSSGSDMKVMPGGLHGSNSSLEDFEDVSDVIPISGYRNSVVSISPDNNKISGTYSGKVDYGFGPGYGRVYLVKKNVDLTNATKISLWVYGDNSGTNMYLSLNNTKSTKIDWHNSAPITINWIGWRKISFNIPELSQHDLMYITYSDTVRLKLDSSSDTGYSTTIFIDELKKEAVGSHTQYDEVACGVCHGGSHEIKRAPDCKDCHQTQEHGWPSEDKYPGSNSTCMECHQKDATENRINISNISEHTELLDGFENDLLFTTSLVNFNQSDEYYSGQLRDNGNHSARLNYTGLTGFLGNSINVTNAKKFKGISIFVNASNDPATKLVLGVFTTKWNNYTVDMDWNGWRQFNVLYHNTTVNENISFNATGTPGMIWMGVYGSSSTGTIYIDNLRQAVSDDYHQYESWRCPNCHTQIKNLPGITDMTSPIVDCSLCHNLKEPHYKQFTRVCIDCHFDSRHAEVENGNFTNYEKASTCLKCHTVPHDFDQTHLETADCNKCHQQRIHGQNYQNVQYNSSKHLDCERCHGKTTAEAPLPMGLGSPRTTILRLSYTYNNETQCLFCHKERIVAYELHINTSVNRSNQTLVERILNDSICNSCHGAKSLLNVSDRDELTAIDPKREPHAPQIDGHGNVSCYKCHGHRPETLTLNYGSNCVGCHQNRDELTELMPGTINDSRLSNVTNPGANQLIVHPPQVTGHGNASCSICHGHINSNLTYIGSTASDCASCHENESKIESLLLFRQPNSTRSTITNPGGNPLYVIPPQVLGHGNTSCRECHEHAPSTFNGFDFIEGMICEDCHQNMSQNVSLIEDTLPKSNRTKMIGNATVISPQVAGHGTTACSVCHSHSAERMVYYGGKNTDCISCHFNESSGYTLLSNGSTVESVQITPHQDMNCTECHGHTPSNMTRINDCRLCHQNATRAQLLAETYGTGLNIISPNSNISAVQVPLLSHSNSAIAGRKWNKTTAYWVNGSDSCQYCHAISHNYSDHNPLGRASAIAGNNTKNSSLAGSYWCASCHFQGYSSGNVTYNDVVKIFLDAGLPVPPEITGNSSYGNYVTSNDGVRYYAHGLSDYSDSSCADCHGNATGATEFLHGVIEGTGGSECLNCHERATGPPEDPDRYPAIVKSAFNKHKNLNSSGEVNVVDNSDCSACHFNISDMNSPNWTTSTKTCMDCHVQGNFSAPIIMNHRPGSGVTITTEAYCSTCHNNSINLFVYSVNASVSHYGTNVSLLKPTVNQTAKPKFGFINASEASSYNNPCNYCHNPSNLIYGTPKNISKTGHIELSTCDQCHINAAADNLHNSSLGIPLTFRCIDCHRTYADQYQAPNLTGTQHLITSCDEGNCHMTDTGITKGYFDVLADHNATWLFNPNYPPTTDIVKLNNEISISVTKGSIVNITSRIKDATREASRVRGAEYFLNTSADPGKGKGTPMNAEDGYYNAVNGLWENLTGTIETGSLSEGIYTVYVRGMDIGKQWSSVQSATLTVLPAKGYINGTVRDNNTKAGIPYAKVSMDTNAGMQANESGFFSLYLDAGIHNLTATKEPEYYSNSSITITVESETTILQDIEVLQKPTGNISGNVRNS